MHSPCPACGSSVEVDKPGDRTCPACGHVFHVLAEQFPWESGVHLANDDVIEDLIAKGETAAPRAPVAPVIAPVVEAVGPVVARVESMPDACEACGQRPAVRACAACHRLVCEVCAAYPSPSLAGCAACYQEAGVEFDEMTSSTFLPMLLPTLREIVFRPAEFFSRLRVPGPLWPAIVFGVIMAVPGGIVTNLSNMLFQTNLIDTLATLNIDIPDEFKSQFTTGAGASTASSIAYSFFYILFVPVGAFIGFFINGAITHLMLMMLGGANAKMEDTIRVVGYGGATSVAHLVPFLGPLVGYVWNVVVVSIGLSRVHRIPGWKAVAAVLIPFVFCCCSAALIAFVVMGAVAGFAGAAS
ncbi:MAG: YIP1 family protein [Deltaproteobacteria bacterium]|nr:YIP1 family protein [Deltaproteobacteria bacterium]